MNFKNDVMFYLSNGKIYNGVNLYEEEKCPKCGKANCKCSGNTEKDEWLKKIKANKKKGAASENLHRRDGLSGDTTDVEDEMMNWARSKINASKSTGTNGGDDGDDNNSSVETLPGKFKNVSRSKNSEENVKEPEDPYGTGRNSCNTEKNSCKTEKNSCKTEKNSCKTEKNSLKEEILAHLNF